MNEFQVFWSQTAQEDLKTIIDYIVAENSDRAEKILARLMEKTAELFCFPLRGRQVPELRYHGITGYREIIHQPWRIIYRVDGDRVFVLAVIDSRRNLVDLLLNRLLDTK